MINKSIIQIIKLYQRLLSPYLHGNNYSCIYPVPCSDYAIQLLESKPIYIAIPQAIYRLLSCNPINAHLIQRKSKS